MEILGDILFCIYIFCMAKIVLNVLNKDFNTKKYIIVAIISLILAIAIFMLSDENSSPSKQIVSSSTEQTINTNLPIPEQIDKHIKKIIDKNDYINVEVNEHMGRNDGTKMVLVYVKAHGYKTYKSALINATKVFKELYTSQLPIGEVCIFFKSDFTDKYGNQSEQTAIKIIMDLNTAQNINWQNFDWRNLPSITNSVYVHPSIDKNE